MADVAGRDRGALPPPRPDHVADEQDAHGGFAFVEVPRLELDELLGQLVERAQEVMASQGRLRGLLRAHQQVGADLELSVVLRRIAEAARELVGARYAALGVIGSDGHLIQFIHAGMPDDTAAVIGNLPQGKGLLGALIDTPEPIRIPHLSHDNRSSGFPAGHPPMDSFLGVPIRIRDEVFGNLYLAESTRGEFNAEDEQLTLALAASAAVAIDNARLYAVARARGQWLRAAATLTETVLAPVEPVTAGTYERGLEKDPLTMIAKCCQKIADADVTSVWLPTPDGQRFRAAITVGSEGALGVEGPPVLEAAGDHPVFREAVDAGTPSRVKSPDGDVNGLVPQSLDVGPMMVLPLRDPRSGRGVVTVVRRRGRPVFTAEDVDMAAGFTNQAAVALGLAQARADQERLVLLDERDRIAADLHDHIIQQLFVTGLSLHSAAAGMPAGRATERVLDAVRDLDSVIGQIRTTIFALNQPPTEGAQGLRAQVSNVLSELTAVLGFEPMLRFTGPIETIAGPELAPDLLAVTREALTNIARHAHATTAQVELTAAGGELILQVSDDGVGMPVDGRRSGLRNMRRRAEQRGGRFTLEPRDPRGTVLTWVVPTG